MKARKIWTVTRRDGCGTERWHFRLRQDARSYAERLAEGWALDTDWICPRWQNPADDEDTVEMNFDWLY